MYYRGSVCLVVNSIQQTQILQSNPQHIKFYMNVLAGCSHYLKLLNFKASRLSKYGDSGRYSKYRIAAKS